MGRNPQFMEKYGHSVCLSVCVSVRQSVQRLKEKTSKSELTRRLKVDLTDSTGQRTPGHPNMKHGQKPTVFMEKYGHERHRFESRRPSDVYKRHVGNMMILVVVFLRYSPVFAYCCRATPSLLTAAVRCVR